MTITSYRATSRRTQRRHARLLEEQRAEPPMCKSEPGVFKPDVDPTRCEGKGDCAVVCPQDVFEIGRMPGAAFASLPTLAKLKVLAHGRQTALTPNVDACRACGSCVSACPEHAIKLVRATR